MVQHPWVTGAFNVSLPPYWTPAPSMNCSVRTWDVSAAATCLHNRTIYVAGNSRARGYFYELPVMLRPHVDRDVVR